MAVVGQDRTLYGKGNDFGGLADVSNRFIGFAENSRNELDFRVFLEFHVNTPYSKISFGGSKTSS